MNPQKQRAQREIGIAAAATFVTIALRLAFALRSSFCGTPDACAYLGLAQSLGTGKGFNARFLFDLQQDVLSLPTHAIEYWRPGTSFFLLLARPFGAVTLHSSLVVTTLAGIAFAAAAWVIAMKATASRRVALYSYLLCLMLPPFWVESTSPDSGMFYGMAVAWFLALLTVRRHSVAQDVGALLFVGITYSIRNDGILLLLPLVAVLWQRRRIGEGGSSPAYVAMMLTGFVLALVPIHLLNAHVLGTAFPSGTSRALFIDGFDGFSLYHQPVNIHTLLATGIAHLVKVRVTTFSSVVYRNLALGVGFGVAFVPLLLLRRTDTADTETAAPEFTGSAVFLLGVLLMYTFLMPVIGEFSALRAFLGLLPLSAVLIVVAILRVARDKRLAAVLASSVIAAYLISGVMLEKRDVAGGNEIGDGVRTLERELRAAGVQPGTSVLMAASPVQLSVMTGYTTVTLPSNGPAAMQGLANDVGVTHVLLDGSYSPAEVERICKVLTPSKETLLPDSKVLLLSLPDIRRR